MSLKLAKNNTPSYDYYSEGDGSDPVSISATLNNTGGTVNTATITAYLIATTYNYTGISMSVLNEQTGIDWKLSVDNATWLDALTSTQLPAMNATTADQVKTIYIRGVINNNGTVATGTYTAPDIQVAYTENPA